MAHSVSDGIDTSTPSPAMTRNQVSEDHTLRTLSAPYAQTASMHKEGSLSVAGVSYENNQ